MCVLRSLPAARWVGLTGCGVGLTGCGVGLVGVRRLGAAMLVSLVVAVTGAAVAWSAEYLSAQLVVGDPAVLASADTVIKNILEGEGYTVALVDDGDAVTAAADSTDLVVISPSTSGVVLGSKYGPVDVPEVVFASTAWDSMGLTEEDGSFYDSTSLAWVDASHPVAAWLPSPVQVVPTGQSMRSMVVAHLADGATPVAVRATNSAQNVIFTFDPGDELTTGAAPAARVVAGLSEPALVNLNADGLQLVVNLVTWAAEGEAPLLDAVAAQAAPTHCGEFTAVVACYELNDTGHHHGGRDLPAVESGERDRRGE